MIDEKKLIEEMWNNFNSYYNDANRFNEEETKMADRVLGGVQCMIESQPKVGEWIPVIERLPEEYDNNINDSSISIPVLVQYKNDVEEPEVLHYNTFTKKFCYDQMDFTSNVAAWQPLPEPYRKDVE